MVKRHRDNLAGEHVFGDAGQLISCILFLAVWITDVFVFKYSTLLNDFIPLAVRLPLGIIVLVLAAYLVWTGMATLFGESKGKPHVVSNGVFKVVRHPIYLSEMLFYLALFLLSMSLAALAAWIIIAAFLHYISRYEERLLLAQFGEDYRQYMRDVPMYFPRFTRRGTKPLK